MQPYYDADGITIYCGKAEDIIPGLGAVDWTFADPPYNVGLDYIGHDDRQKDDVYAEWCESWFRPLVEVTASSVVITPGAVNLGLWHRIERPRWVMAWTKGNGRGRNRIGKPDGFQKWEPVLVYGRAKKCVPLDWIDCPIVEVRSIDDHPCPKPENLMRKLIADFTEPGDLILDPFGGSGTTARAAKDLERRCILIEKEEAYCEIAAKRLAQTVMPLFASVEVA